jgi:hypothetical protein
VFEAQNMYLFKKKQIAGFSGINFSYQATAVRVLTMEALMVVYNVMDQGG